MNYTLDEIISLIGDYKTVDGNGTGGSLHIYTDDGNIEYSSIKHCEEWAKEEKDYIGMFIARLLLELTEKERMTIYDKLWN